MKMQKKYLTIYNDLAKQIQANHWPKTAMLPSENELTEMYSTSRETIRKALDLLAQDGYIQKVRGKGSVVIDINKFDFPVSGIVSFKELTKNLQLSANTIVNELAEIETDEELGARLGIGTGEAVWKVVRSREIDGEKIILDKDFFNKSHVPSLTEEVCKDSIYNFLENELGLIIGFARKEIVVEEPNEEDRAYMDLEGYSTIVVIKSSVYLNNASLFQYTESRHRPDKFRFVDFARRIKN